MFPCANHPTEPTSRTCAGCGRPFCEACLTELMHRPVCGWCRDRDVARAQSVRTVDPAAVVLWARVFDGVALLCTGGITGLYGFMFSMPMLMSPRVPGAAAPPPGFPVVGFGVAGLILALEALVFLPPLLFLGNRSRWAWYWQMVALVLAVVSGLPFCTSYGLVTISGAIAIGVFWIRPEVREYFEPAA
jgi:hypothetical protein